MSVFSHEFADVIFCKTLDILEIISDCRSDPNTLIDIELLANSYMIACTNIQNFEEEENCASTVSVDHSLGFDMKFIGSDMISFGYDLILIGSRVQDILVPLVVVLNNFGVKKQVPKISFKSSVGI